MVDVGTDTGCIRLCEGTSVDLCEASCTNDKIFTPQTFPPSAAMRSMEVFRNEDGMDEWCIGLCHPQAR